MLNGGLNKCQKLELKPSLIVCCTCLLGKGIEVIRAEMGWVCFSTHFFLSKPLNLPLSFHPILNTPLPPLSSSSFSPPTRLLFSLSWLTKRGGGGGGATSIEVVVFSVAWEESLARGHAESRPHKESREGAGVAVVWNHKDSR